MVFFDRFCPELRGTPNPDPTRRERGEKDLRPLSSNASGAEEPGRESATGNPLRAPCEWFRAELGSPPVIILSDEDPEVDDVVSEVETWRGSRDELEALAGRVERCSIGEDFWGPGKSEEGSRARDGKLSSAHKAGVRRMGLEGLVRELLGDVPASAELVRRGELLRNAFLAAKVWKTVPSAARRPGHRRCGCPRGRRRPPNQRPRVAPPWL